jgi:hypothetical protein
MLGWNDLSLAFIREICLANESEGGGVIVILSTQEKQTIQDEINSFFRDSDGFRGTKIVIAHGNPLILVDLKRVSASLARSIVIFRDDEQSSDVCDSNTLRIILTLKTLPSVHRHTYIK